MMVLICLIFSVLSTIEQYTGFADETLFWMVFLLLSLCLCQSVSCYCRCVDAACVVDDSCWLIGTCTCSSTAACVSWLHWQLQGVVRSLITTRRLLSRAPGCLLPPLCDCGNQLSQMIIVVSANSLAFTAEFNWLSHLTAATASGSHLAQTHRPLIIRTDMLN